MIGVVMTYYERPFQLQVTLESLEASEADFFVVIVDDNSKDDIQLPEVSYPIKVLKTLDKIWTNPEPAYNIGIQEAMREKPDVIVLQNAECYHVGDVLSYAERVTDSTYISFSCFSIGKEHTFNRVLKLRNKGASKDGEDAWYNHPVYRPVGYDFCSAITRKNLLRLNGYDERFSYGCGYGDDYLLARIKMMGLSVEIPTNPFVVHQWHYSLPETEGKQDLVMRNRVLLSQLVPRREIKAKHIITEDL